MMVDQPGLNRRRLLRGGLLAGIGAATVGSGLLLTPSAAYAGTMVRQEGWRWCKKCQGLFYFGTRFDPHFGRCPAGDVHTITDSLRYSVLGDTTEPWAEYEIDGQQFGWRHCRKCMGLSYIKNGVGRCPASGSHDHTGSYGYYPFYGGAPSTAQDQWRWCDRCQGMFYGPGAPISRCPWGAGHRIGSTSLNYVHLHDE